MEFFDKLSKKATEAYKVTADKTGKVAKETKLKIKMNDLKSQVEDFYIEIGKCVYQKHIREEEGEIETRLEELCTNIDVINEEIESLLKQCLELKDKKQCPECHAKIDKDDNFCFNCGASQPKDDEAQEVEIIEEENNENDNENDE